MAEETTAFSKGEAVADPGEYVCVPCGFRKEYKTGDHFAECTSCLSGTAEGNEEFLEGLEMWEKTSPTPAEEKKTPAA